jgi:putative ABC transport system permease protein
MSRNIGKTLLLLLIVLVLGIVISGAISVQLAVQNTDANLRLNLPAAVTLEADQDAMMEHEVLTGEWPDIDIVNLELLQKIAQLPQVRDYDVSAGGGLLTKELERVVAEDSHHHDSGMGEWDSIELKGVYRSSMLDIEEGIIEMVTGRVFTDQEVESLSYLALVSQNFAELNDLHVGSTFTLYDISWDYRGHDMVESDFFEDDENVYDSRSHDFEVIGIFNPTVEITTGDEWMDREFEARYENTIYVPNSVTIASQVFHHEAGLSMNPDDEWLQGEPEDNLWLTNIYILNDPDDIPAFREAAEELLPEFWMVADAGSNFGAVSGPMETIGGLALTILIIAIVASVIILSLLITLFLRDRKREIGLYLALGENKVKVVAQMMIEVLVVAVVATVIALFVGNLLAGGISETMLRNDMVASQVADGGSRSFGGTLDMMGFSTEPPSTEEVLSNYNVALNLSTIITFLAISTSTVIAATIIPMLYIVRLNPKKIML